MPFVEPDSKIFHSKKVSKNLVNFQTYYWYGYWYVTYSLAWGGWVFIEDCA